MAKPAVKLAEGEQPVAKLAVKLVEGEQPVARLVEGGQQVARLAASLEGREERPAAAVRAAKGRTICPDTEGAECQPPGVG